ncbi:MAG: EamA family transporter [Spirochaetaceae bacterium]
MSKKIPLLFTLYFLFLWGGQLSSGKASLEPNIVNLYLIPLYICFFSRAIIWFIILKKMDLIKAYTISSINYLIMPLLSFLVFGELFKPKHFIGGSIIIIGIWIYKMGEKKTV